MIVRSLQIEVGESHRVQVTNRGISFPVNRKRSGYSGGTEWLLLAYRLHYLRVQVGRGKEPRRKETSNES